MIWCVVVKRCRVIFCCYRWKKVCCCGRKGLTPFTGYLKKRCDFQITPFHTPTPSHLFHHVQFYKDLNHYNTAISLFTNTFSINNVRREETYRSCKLIYRGGRPIASRLVNPIHFWWYGIDKEQAPCIHRQGEVVRKEWGTERGGDDSVVHVSFEDCKCI